MGRYRDESGIENTCPKIDEVISAIDSVNWSEESYWDAKMVKEIMETIRKANSDLREWGNKMCKEKNELEEQVTDLEKEIKSLRSGLDDYKDQTKELENKVEILEDELNTQLSA